MEIVVGIIIGLSVAVIITISKSLTKKKPQLELFTEIKHDGSHGSRKEGFHKCKITYGVVNKGKAIAKHAQLLLHVEPYGIDIRWGLTGNGTNGLDRIPTVGEYERFGADADQVIHPGDRVAVTATRFDISNVNPDIQDVVIKFQLAAEDIKQVKGTRIIKAKEIIDIVRPKEER